MTTFGGVVPSSTSQITYSYRENSYQYGNGYESVQPDGANGQIVGGTAEFDNLDAVRGPALLTWLKANPSWISWAGDGVLLPTTQQFRVAADGYQIQYKPGNIIDSIQVAIKSVF